MARYQNKACCVMGDFNAVWEPSERKDIGALRVDRLEMDRFNLFIDTCQLFDIPVVGRLFTWYRPNDTSRSRLDRVLVSETWMQKWPGTTQFVHSKQVSDHCALVVKNKLVDWGPKPFRYFDVWQNEAGFKQVVKSAWDLDIGCGNPLEKVKLKLKEVKKEVKSWVVEAFNSDKLKEQQLLHEIDALDQYDDEGNLQEFMRIKRIQLLGDLRILSEKENAMLRQKSRVDWLAKGDQNSKFFHSTLRWRRISNDIKGLVLNGEWCDDLSRLRAQ